MKDHFERYMSALDNGNEKVCQKLCELEGIDEKTLNQNADYLNGSLLINLKENLHNLKSKYLYEYTLSVYSKATGIKVYFDTPQVLKDDDTLQDEQIPGSLSHVILSQDIFLLCISHMSSLMSNKITTNEQKMLIVSILSLISIFAEEREIQNICRRQKFLQTFVKLFSDIIASANDLSPIEANIITLTTHVLAKLSNKSKKNQDYLIRKKVHDIFKVILMTAEKNTLLFQGTAGLIGNLAHSQDSRLLLWTSGVLSTTKKLLITCQSNLKIVEFSYMMIVRLSQECREIVEDIRSDQAFMETLNHILATQQFQDIKFQKSENLSIFSFCLGIVRKIGGFSDLRGGIMKKYSNYPLNYIEKNENISPTGPSSLVQIFALKEALALIGVFAIEEEGRQVILKQLPRLSSTIVRLSINLIFDHKLVKVSLGCLTNLCVMEQIREELSKEKDFYVLIYAILEKYDYSGGMLEYCLKMIMNNCSNSVSFKNFSAPKMILKLLFLGFAYQSSLPIVQLTSKILKTLCSDPLVLQNIVKCFREYENSNSMYRFVQVLVTHLKLMVTANLIDSILEIISFLAYICTIDKLIIQELQDKTDFLNIIKDILDTKRPNQKELQRISSSLAYLPLEEFKGLLLL